MRAELTAKICLSDEEKETIASARDTLEEVSEAISKLGLPGLEDTLYELRRASLILESIAGGENLL